MRDSYLPRRLKGHEGCGEIIDIGGDAWNSGYAIVRSTLKSSVNPGLNRELQGDVVALFAIQSCWSEECIECSRDLPQLCKNGHHSGIGQDGFFTEYATVDAKAVVKLPAGTSTKQEVDCKKADPKGDEGVSPLVGAVSTDAVTTAYHAVVKRAEVKRSETVFLFGLGGLGFNALQIIRHMGARVIVSDTRQEILDAAMAVGVPESDIVPVGSSVQEFVKSAGLESKIDTVLDFVGVHQTFEDAQHVGKCAVSHDP